MAHPASRPVLLRCGAHRRGDLRGLRAGFRAVAPGTPHRTRLAGVGGRRPAGLRHGRSAAFHHGPAVGSRRERLRRLHFRHRLRVGPGRLAGGICDRTSSRGARGSGSVTTAEQAARRRTFAVISHPDAGKSTLTEALSLHARAIGQAGAVHGKAGRRGTVSDWMDMERDRGISITSSALQFGYRDAVVNLVDTPGHSDFSEDTYRVLTAVDSAVMLLDAAKGLEAQTMKLFGVCASRQLPIITVVNKWDRPGLDALALMDEITDRTGLRPTPLTWPVGIAGDFRGVLDRRTGDFIRFRPTAGGATVAPTERLTSAEAEAKEGDAWREAVMEHELLSADGYDHDQQEYLAERTTPVLFTSAVLNFGVGQLLDVLYELAPAPGPRLATDGTPRAIDAPFSAQVFKVQAGMDSAHRDRLAFARVCSGVFHRGDVVTHSQSGRSFATKYVHAVFGRDRETLEVAYPGDVIGLVNAGSLRAGNTLWAEEPVEFPPIPSFAPEHFKVVRANDPSRYKQFQRGIDQLDQEGVVQVLRSERRGNQQPILAAVGPMQFEVAAHRLEHELRSPVTLESLPYSLARRTRAEDVESIERRTGTEVAVRGDGAILALLTNRWQMQILERDNPTIVLEPLVADVADGSAPTP
ncbi:MAG: peptide chain release factor 3 [Actinobacteria bacterium]|nr:peptide chain release factor 3 [Actinomycetota bacterium]